MGKILIKKDEIENFIVKHTLHLSNIYLEGSKKAENISDLCELSFSNLSSLDFYFSGEDKVVLEKIKISKDNIILFESRRFNNVQIIIDVEQNK